MNTADALAQSILQKQSLADCSVEELQVLAHQYPYFSAAQLLLAEKWKTAEPSRYNDQLDQASLHFTNPLWLDLLLNNNGTGAATLEPSLIAQAAPDTEHSAEETLPDLYHTSVEMTTSEVPRADASFVDATEPVITDIERQQEAPAPAITFEPYHTVDYFASQGIKFVADEKPGDRFGQQLKSFTDWLKTMKRLPETDALKLNSPASDEKVQQMANHSIAEKDVFTETMAEVWLKQGNREKAIEIYGKLGLLNPGKSAYFASLIEQIKNS